MTRRAFRPVLFILPVVLLLIAVVLVRPTLPSYATGANIVLSLTYGPPTSSVQVKGKGFKGSETVTLTFDTTQVGSVKASTTGAFSATIAVPSSAQPGNHVVQGKGKSSGLFAQAAFLVQTDWVQQGFNREHTGFNVFENTLTAGNVGHLTQSWAYISNDWVGSTVVAHGVVYLGCYQTYVCALSAATGQLLWSHNITEQFAALPAVVNGLVYVNTAGGYVEALNTASGSLVWSYATGFAITDAPLTANGLVYSGASNGVLYALNGTSGQVVWTHTFPSIFSTPSIDGGLLYVSAGGTLYALQSQTGKIVWHVPAKGGTPVVANGMVFLIDAADSKLLALNEQTGAIVWSNGYQTTYSSPGDPSIANGVVYITLPNSCELEALSTTTGAVLWQYNSWGIPTCIKGTPIVANGVVYVGASDDQDPDCYCSAVFAISATTGGLAGYIEDDYSEAAGDNNAIVVVNGTLYYSDGYDGVFAYSLPAAASKKSV